MIKVKKISSADLLSISRIPLAVIIIPLAINHLWTFAFWVILIAITTDILDGEVARRMNNANTELGKMLENVADSAFAIGMITGLFLTHHMTLMTILVMVGTFVPLTIFEMLGKDKTILKRIGIAGTPFYYIITITILLYRYAFLAFGQMANIIAVGEILTMIILGYIKRRRLLGWLQGKI